jgi:hypothetical protein
LKWKDKNKHPVGAVEDVESCPPRSVLARVSGRFPGAENLKLALLPELKRYAKALKDLRKA